MMEQKGQLYTNINTETHVIKHKHQTRDKKKTLRKTQRLSLCSHIHKNKQTFDFHKDHTSRPDS